MASISSDEKANSVITTDDDDDDLDDDDDDLDDNDDDLDDDSNSNSCVTFHVRIANLFVTGSYSRRGIVHIRRGRCSAHKVRSCQRMDTHLPRNTLSFPNYRALRPYQSSLNTTHTFSPPSPT
jgi:hypothetical protein